MTGTFIKRHLPCTAAWLGAALFAFAPVKAMALSPIPARPAAATGAPAATLGPRITTSLRGEPLQRLLSLVENTTSTRFRYGAPVDTLVTETFDNAPLWPSLEALLLKSGFHMQRSGESVFLFRNQPLMATTPRHSPPPKGGRAGIHTGPKRVLQVPATIAPTAWQYWALSSPPPEDWAEVQPTPRLPVLIEGPNIAPGWRSVELTLAADKSPGVSVRLPSMVTTNYLRWPMKLRDIPLAAQLLVETSAPATLYVNGAPMFRRRSGRQLIDLSQVLRIGDNCLALQWEQPRPADATGSKPAMERPATTPSLHYEWFFSERRPEN